MATVTITVSLFASGCLPGVLEQRIQEVERRLTSVSNHQFSEGAAANAEAFLDQLRECLAAVRAARASRPATEREGEIADKRDRLRAVLQWLANCCDDVGVKHFDTDTSSEEVSAMKAATLAARAALAE